METAASYWEPVIKIYGSSIKTELVIATLRFPEDRLAFWGRQLQGFEDGLGSFEMAVSQRVEHQTLQFVLLYSGVLEESYGRLLSDAVAREVGSYLSVRSPVELLYFHGPHFQDRYGVADAAFSALKKYHLEIFAAGCTGTSIYLVTPEKKARVVAKVLTKVFFVPIFS